MTPITASAERSAYSQTRAIKLELRVNCGCGASFRTLIDGENHALQTGHTLHIAGEIRPQ